MESINLNDRRFRPLENSSTGEADAQTIFTYHQQDDLVWAEYKGGKIFLGQIIGIALPDGKFELRYQHLNEARELKTGICLSTPEILPDGRIQLHESWQWTCDDHSSGESLVEEILSLDYEIRIKE